MSSKPSSEPGAKNWRSRQFTNTTLHGLLLLIEHGLSLVELLPLFLRKDFRDSLLASSTNEDVKMVPNYSREFTNY